LTHTALSGVLNPSATRFGLDLVDARSGKAFMSAIFVDRN